MVLPKNRKNLSVVFIALTILPATALPALAEPRCEDLENRWTQTYLKDFSIGWDTSTFSCHSAESRFAAALFDLDTYDFDTNQLDYSPDFYELVRKNVNQFKYDGQCGSGVLAYTSRRDITVCKSFFSDSREDRASTLVHETRHTQASDVRHVTCVGGKYDGKTAACDEVFHNGHWKGSGYNADIYFLGWVLKYGRGNELSRAVTQSEINSMVPNRFNHITSEDIKSWRN